MQLVVLGTAFLLATPSIAFAQTQGFCGQDTTFVRLWENVAGDTSDGNDSLHLCNSSQNLAGINHTLAGECNRTVFPDSSTWDNCVDSWSIFLPSNEWVACAYGETLFGGYVSGAIVGPRTGNRYNLAAQDYVSSVRIMHVSGGAYADDCY
jgi:hypothetical protein